MSGAHSVVVDCQYDRCIREDGHPVADASVGLGCIRQRRASTYAGRQAAEVATLTDGSQLVFASAVWHRRAEPGSWGARWWPGEPRHASLDASRRCCADNFEGGDLKSNKSASLDVSHSSSARSCGPWNEGGRLESHSVIDLDTGRMRRSENASVRVGVHQGSREREGERIEGESEEEGRARGVE